MSAYPVSPCEKVASLIYYYKGMLKFMNTICIMYIDKCLSVTLCIYYYYFTILSPYKLDPLLFFFFVI